MLAAQILNLQTPSPPVPPAPAAQVVPKPAGGFERSDDDEFMAEVRRLEHGDRVNGEELELGDEPIVSVTATSLDVEVRATFLDVEVVERGNIVVLVARFGGDPDEVYVSYMKPGSARPVVDDGFGRPGSKIRRTDVGVYVFQIDTIEFAGGELEWHFWSVGEHQASEFGTITIPERPVQLL